MFYIIDLSLSLSLSLSLARARSCINFAFIDLFGLATSSLILFDRTGIGRVIAEAVKKPSTCRESGVGALLYNIMKGYSSRFHSKAERVLKLLTSKAIYSIGDKAIGKKANYSTDDKADEGKLVFYFNDLDIYDMNNSFLICLISQDFDSRLKYSSSDCCLSY